MDQNGIILLSLLFVFTVALLAYNLLNNNCNASEKSRRRRNVCNEYEENFVENIEPTATGSIMLTDPNGNLSIFNVGSGKTLVSSATGDITTIPTGQFDGPVTANQGISGTTGTFTRSLTAATGTFTGSLTAATGTFTGLNVNGDVSSTTGTFTGALTANGGISSTTGTFTGALTANGGISVTDLNANGSLTASGLNTKLINAPVSANTWLQVNSNGNAQNGVAVQNALSIVDGGANGGLSVGKWNDSSNSPGNGNIYATGNITAAGQVCIGSTCITAADLVMVKKLTGGFKLIGNTGSLYHNFNATNGNWGGNPFFEFTNNGKISGHNGDWDTWKLL